jgi:hypothetical protein
VNRPCPDRSLPAAAPRPLPCPAAALDNLLLFRTPCSRHHSSPDHRIRRHLAETMCESLETRRRHLPQGTRGFASAPSGGGDAGDRRKGGKRRRWARVPPYRPRRATRGLVGVPFPALACVGRNFSIFVYPTIIPDWLHLNLMPNRGK